jgi:SAM-dependent methyltransferase
MLLTAVAKRAALSGTIALGGLQRAAGRRFPWYANLCRRAAGYAAYAMAGEPFVPAAVLPTPPDVEPIEAISAPPAPPAHIEAFPGYIIAIEEPVGPIESGFFHLRGWLAFEHEFPDVHAVVNGVEYALYRYDRPDVRDHFPLHRTSGFSAFVRLGNLPAPERIAIRLAAGTRTLFECSQAATANAVALARQEEAARWEKRAWILPRVSCLVCTGDLDEKACCRSCGRPHEVDGVLDCLPPDTGDIDFRGTVCSHGYDADVERIIAQAEAGGGRILDCGAGLRPAVRSNVITTEVFPYPTTDVLAANQRLPFKDAVFSAVLSLHVLEHVPDPFACARELQRVLKPGGTLFAVTPMIIPEHGVPHHFFNPTREGLARLFGRTTENSLVFVPALGHPINAIWTVVNFYRDSLPEAQRGSFLALTMRELLARPMEEWIAQDVALALNEEGRMRLAGNLCIEFVK